MSLLDVKEMKTRNDCEIACDCVKRANVVLHVGLCEEIFARKHTATHKPTSAQPLSAPHSDQRDIHLTSAAWAARCPSASHTHTRTHALALRNGNEQEMRSDRFTQLVFSSVFADTGDTISLRPRGLARSRSMQLRTSEVLHRPSWLRGLGLGPS